MSTLTIGIIGGIIETLLTILVFYYFIKTAKALAGGVIGEATKKMAVGSSLMMISVILLGWGLGYFKLQDKVWAAIVGTALPILGTLFLIAGARGMLKSTKK